MKNNATNSTYMKFSNRRLVLSIVSKRPVSRADLARMTGLTRAAVTIIVNELIKDGVLLETGTAEADYGRKPVLLDLNPECFYSIGVSITRDGCYIGIIDIKGMLLIKRKIILKSTYNANECLKIIIGDIEKIIADSSVPCSKFLGMGISAPGPVDINTGTILTPPNFNVWHNVNIVKELKRNFNLNIYLENNSTSLALAEKNYGRGVEFTSFMLMVVDTGIGAGIIMNDDLYRGVGGFGSEVGHTSIDMNGKQCSCGNRGCLEVFASMPSALYNVNQSGRTVDTWNEIVDKALNGDEVCMKAIDSEALYLSYGIVNAINILELEAVILTGDINYKAELLLNKIRENVGNLAVTRHIRKLHIMNSSISENPEVISAASIMIEKFFKGEIEL